MIDKLPIFLSILPFLVFIFLLVVKRTSLLKSSIITLVLYTALIVFYWKIVPNYLYISYGKGFFIALDIFFIIFGAILFLEILKDLKIIKNISHYLSRFSTDYRVQIIMIAWMFESFLEGTAGFGTAGAIAIPLLIALGLSPMKALIVGLLGNSTAVLFGAAGTPIRVGFAGLPVASVPLISSMLNVVGIIVPIFMLWIITRGRENKNKEFFEALPFAIWSGVAFVIPSILFVSFGQEFPSILGSLVGMVLLIITSRFGIFTPKNKYSLIENNNEEKIDMSIFKSFLPYFILIALLILGKFVLGNLNIPIELGFSHKFSLFNPGFIFVITTFIIAVIWKSKIKTLYTSSRIAFLGAWAPFLVIVSMSTIVQMMILSSNNTSFLPSAISLIAKGFETNMLPFFAPFVGAFGSFITGSATVSNVMFGNFFYTASNYLGFDPSIILSLGVVGASAGNMTALADILAAEAVTPIKNSEIKIIKGVIIPCLTYLVILGIIGILIL